ncbi:MAG TPA: DUF3592 domain-containing protein [candidate division Zixibacteria bacterium]|nr:DUF3592 domain-containing protein [candidate division Zixibacteria bacterium]MDD4918753.1 DUF3592 domain-containing protein [candidate division Zixibacteria bacterium]MDM7974282.1 DUF3592 domain-containing protein [candidate division Zixibacteria bacterium]HPI33409.1 DUF3592 domain-containing protein [candidate division Zixibacteria bacterium]HPM37022.1 DUF3592 domain-containing protein [candidate division Zixibacteria bacterium]
MLHAVAHLFPIIVILAAAAPASAAALWLVRRRLPPLARPWVRRLGAAAGAVGIVLAITAFARTAARREQREWPHTEGRIVAARVVGERSFVPEIAYEYTVGATRYAGTCDRNVPLFGNKRRDYDVARKEAARYGEGEAVTVYYDPEDPSRSTILPEPRWNDYAQTGLGVFLWAGGVVMVWWPRRR